MGAWRVTGWTFGEKPWRFRAADLKRERLNADWAAVKGPLGGVIGTLRARARAARRVAWVFLGGLILTVLAGLALYLFLPLWENWVDARKATFEATLSAIAAEDSGLDDDRNSRIHRDGEGGVSPGLAQLLRGQWERLAVPGSQTVWLRGTAPAPGGGLLVYGRDSTLLHLPADGSAPVRLAVPGSQTVSLWRTAPAPGGGLLVYGDESTLLHLTDHWSNKIAALVLADGRDGDAALEAFLDTELPPHIREWPPFLALRDELTNLQNRREALSGVAAGVQVRIRELDDLPYAGWRRDQLRLAFGTFLATCRGMQARMPP